MIAIVLLAANTNYKVKSGKHFTNWWVSSIFLRTSLIWCCRDFKTSGESTACRSSLHVLQWRKLQLQANCFYCALQTLVKSLTSCVFHLQWNFLKVNSFFWAVTVVVQVYGIVYISRPCIARRGETNWVFTFLMPKLNHLSEVRHRKVFKKADCFLVFGCRVITTDSMMIT